ncbi:MAG: metallophosphoesterase [Paracoccaceae bacterium]|nr:metallophosphoesterase [Paracoccaceae bacterium]
MVYAVGDIHGCHRLARSLVARIIEDIDAQGAPAMIVFMGDYIDRGENSRKTVEFLIEFAAWAAGEPMLETVFLMGNHEQMLMQFLRAPDVSELWLRSGGLQTLMSYGLGHPGNLADPENALRLRESLIAALGGHLGFIQALKMRHAVGNVFFAHAGANPAQRLDNQPIETLLWGHQSFLTTPRSDGIWVVHGHFVVERPSAVSGRIAVDTGAYASRRLTAARIADGEVSFLQAQRGKA